MKSSLTIGQTAKKAGVNIQTLRYYEGRGLLLANARTEAGYRLYSEESVQRLRFIKHAQELGFSLSEIERLLKLRVKRPNQCEKIRKEVEARLKVVKDKILSLRSIEKTLENLRRACQTRKISSDCPILKSLDNAKTKGESQ
jgi:MerR family mercuric resistance operon transcriptional regulator